MAKKAISIVLWVVCGLSVAAQKKAAVNTAAFPDSIAPVGILHDLSDSALLDVVQRQTFRYFWHFAHPVSGLARERSNSIRGEYFWDYANEAYNEPNLSTGTYGPEACAIGGTGFGVLATIVAVERNW